MRVLLSAFQCSPVQGSEPGNGWHWATSLADYGHDITVLTTSGEKETVLAAAPPGVDFRFIDLPESPLPRSSHLWTYDIYQQWQKAALRHVETARQQYDVAHHVTWASMHLGSMLWRLPVPLVYGPIGGGQTAPANYWRHFGRQLPAETFRTICARSLLTLNTRSRATLRNSAITLVANSATAVASRRLGATDVRYMLADGLPREWIAEPRSRPAGTPVVLWVGRLLPHKAPSIAVEAFAGLRRVMPARMIIAGEGPLRGQVCATIERLGLTEDVQLLGYVPWADIKRLYDSASVFLFTSLRETFGAPFLEALGRGLPAVAVDLHGIADVEAGPGAVKVALTPRPADLPGRLASALQTVLSDDDWDLRSVAAVKWATMWMWPAKAAAATQIYREIMGRRN